MQKEKLSDIKKYFSNLYDYKYSVLAGLFAILCLVFLWLSFSKLPASIASPLTGTYIIFVLLFSKLFLKETLTKKDTLGIILILIGVFGISFLYK